MWGLSPSVLGLSAVSISMRDGRKCSNWPCRGERETRIGLSGKDGGGEKGRNSFSSASKQASGVESKACLARLSQPFSSEIDPLFLHPLSNSDTNRTATTSTSSGTTSLRAVSCLCFSLVPKGGESDGLSSGHACFLRHRASRPSCRGGHSARRRFFFSFPFFFS